jgi:hypothetical protein
MDDDTDWISRKDAIGWLVRGYELSVGAAEAALKAALSSGNVRTTACFGDFEAIQVPADDFRRFPIAYFLRDQRINFDDLRWQVQRQAPALPAPPVAATAKVMAKPEQEVLNRALRELAEQRGEKLKQGDQEGDALLEKLGARTRQIQKAYQALPEEYRYFRGKPR